MKKTLKYIAVGLLMTAASFGQLTVDEALDKHADLIANRLTEATDSTHDLESMYLAALTKLEAKLKSQVQTTLDLDNYNALVAEIKSVKEKTTITDISKVTNNEFKKLRKIFTTEKSKITNQLEGDLEKYNNTLAKALQSIEAAAIKSGNLDEATLAKTKLSELNKHVKVIEERLDVDSGKSVRFFKKFGGYVHAKSKVKVKLDTGKRYTLTVKMKYTDGELTNLDYLPHFYSTGEKFEGGASNPLHVRQRNSEVREVETLASGWDLVTITFTHAHEGKLQIGFTLYDSGNVDASFKDFSLRDEDGKELITKNLNQKSGWEENGNLYFE